jgi:hypothetical protein
VQKIIDGVSSLRECLDVQHRDLYREINDLYIVPLKACPHADIVAAAVLAEEEEKKNEIEQNRAYQRKIAERDILAQKASEEKKRKRDLQTKALAVAKESGAEPTKSLVPSQDSPQGHLDRRNYVAKTYGVDDSAVDEDGDDSDKVYEKEEENNADAVSNEHETDIHRAYHPVVKFGQLNSCFRTDMPGDQIVHSLAKMRTLPEFVDSSMPMDVDNDSVQEEEQEVKGGFILSGYKGDVNDDEYLVGRKKVKTGDFDDTFHFNAVVPVSV